MKKILVTRKLLKENENKLSELFDAKLNPDDRIYTAQEIIDESKDCDGIFSSVTDPISADTISKFSSSIKIIANGAVGFGNIDFKEARNKGIAVTNSPDVLIYLIFGLFFRKKVFQIFSCAISHIPPSSFSRTS